tara:strand:- start:153360 stop:153929 length:570 start_codon:yes stop_codon:yes gene_type:complete
MSAIPSRPRLSADDRYELASRAAMHERQSRPVHFVVFGLIVFVAALIFIAVAWNHNSAANKKLLGNHLAAVNVERMIAQISELESAQTQSTDDDRFSPIPDIKTRIERIGEQMGLSIPIPRNTQPRTEGNARLLSFPYTVRDESLEKILQWIQQSQTQIPGLEVREITINLNAKSWQTKVTLTRYERIE